MIGYLAALSLGFLFLYFVLAPYVLEPMEKRALLNAQKKVEEGNDARPDHPGDEE